MNNENNNTATTTAKVHDQPAAAATVDVNPKAAGAAPTTITADKATMENLEKALGKEVAAAIARGEVSQLTQEQIAKIAQVFATPATPVATTAQEPAKAQDPNDAAEKAHAEAAAETQAAAETPFYKKAGFWWAVGGTVALGIVAGLLIYWYTHRDQDAID